MNAPERAIQTTRRTSYDRQRTVNRGRHEKFCTMCKHPKREEMECDFVNWRSPAEIAKQYRLSDRGTVYRHAHVFGSLQKGAETCERHWSTS
jgi:hypothetical protein